MSNIPSSSTGGSSNPPNMKNNMQSNDQPSSSSGSQNHHVRNEQHNLRSLSNNNHQLIPPDEPEEEDSDDEDEDMDFPEENKMIWLVVEMESAILNKYFLVEADDVLGYQDLDILNTGKLVYVSLNGKLQRCNVVMASEDKKFIFEEYKQLNKVSEDNLKMKDVQFKKRRRMSSPQPGCSKRMDDNDSSLSGWSGVSEAATHDRIISPSVNLKQKLAKSYETRHIPPMTFDQGTQTKRESTGLNFSNEIIRLLEINEHLMNEQKVVVSETKVNRLLMESYSEEFITLKKSMRSIEHKFELLMQERNNKNDSTTSKKVSSTKILNGSVQPYYIIDGSIGGSIDDTKNAISINGSKFEYTVEEIPDANDSGRSTSRMSFNQDQSTMMSNSSLTSGEFNSTKKQSFRRSASSSNFSMQSSSSSTPLTKTGRQSNSNQSLTEEWADVEGDFMIGSNKTVVPVHVLRSIDWGNYKSATRKMLITLFSRETLATRSLTGRPSPAFHDRNKPVKGKLDQDIINDIIQLVTKRCGAQESQVRTAITTKCADENKMLRNRKENEDKEKEKFKQPTQTAVRKDADKENFHGNGN
ncbi:unnamed protein product [Diamesa serratosioi]